MAYKYNPFTGTLDIVGSGGEPGGGITSLIPQEGSPVNSTNQNIDGLDYKNTPVVTTFSETDNFYIEDRTWFTPYVVDQNITPGERATFSTIQAAIDKAFTDGNATGNNVANIKLRNGDYAEELVFPSNTNYFIYSEKIVDVGSRSASFGARFSGSVINLTASSIIFQNVFFRGNNFIFSATGGSDFSFVECLFTLGTLDLTGIFKFENTYVGVDVTLQESSLLSIDNSAFPTQFSFNCPSVGSAVEANNSSFGNIIGNNNDNGTLKLFNCSFLQLQGTYSTIIGNNIVVGCTNLLNSGTLFPLIQANGAFNISGCSGNIYDANPTIYNTRDIQGNVITSVVTATDHIASIYEYYIGVTNTSSARTITLPDPSDVSVNLAKDQTFIIKDQSGGAGTNNITVNTTGGLIDGAANKVINTNYGSINVKSDGVNYWII